MKINLYDWSGEELTRIGRFLDWWVAQYSNDAVAFPLDMEPGEWDEQYKTWKE